MVIGHRDRNRDNNKIKCGLTTTISTRIVGFMELWYGAILTEHFEGGVNLCILGSIQKRKGWEIMRTGSGRVGKINVQGYLDVRQVAGVAASLQALGFLDRGVSWSAFLNDTLEFVERICRESGSWQGQEVDLVGALEYLEEMGFSMAQLRDRKRNSSLANAFKREVEDEIRESMTLSSNVKVKKPVNKEIEEAAMEAIRGMQNASGDGKVRVTEEQRAAFGDVLVRDTSEGGEYDVVRQSGEGERIVTSALPPGFNPVAPEDNLEDNEAAPARTGVTNDKGEKDD